MESHTFPFRRDFADELGFGEYLMSSAGAASVTAEDIHRNFELGLSARTPRFVGCFVKNGVGIITGDGMALFETPVDGLFGLLINRLEQAIEVSPVLRAVRDASLFPPSMAAQPDGTPTNLVLLDTRNSRAFFIRAKEGLEILRNQSELAPAA
jgi:hypothetical protein